MENSMMHKLAAKLGVNTDSTIRKAEELARIVETKSASAFLNSSSSVAVICLELAAAHHSQHVDRTKAIQLSSLPKKSYITSYKLIEQMLNMKPDMSISNLSVQFGCSEARKFAEEVLSSYQLTQQNVDLEDVNKDLFNAASLYVAGRKLKLKMDKTKLLSCIGAHRSAFDRLVTQLDKIASDLLAAKSCKVTSKEAPSTANLDLDLEKSPVAEEDVEQKFTGKQKTNHVEEEPFYAWREHILSQATELLARKS